MKVSEVKNMCCMIGMAQYPDKFFDLAIVDPPYGIGVDNMGLGKGKKITEHKNKYADIRPPSKYFKELIRVSKNQIIWGGNYFISDLHDSRCCITWDKIQEFSGADFELAWTSFDSPSKTFRMSRVEAYSLGTINPTQKPVALYKWLLKNYAKEGDKILDTHLGSGSSRIAAYHMGFDFWGFELDRDYFEAQEKRFKEQTAQGSLFDYGQTG
jgi:site-specific DNA-methyltransferase (adenine-specific)